MTQVLVTLEDHSTVGNVMKAIGMLHGVASATLYHSGTQTKKRKNSKLSPIAPQILKLRGSAKAALNEESCNDDRLNYLLNR